MNERATVPDLERQRSENEARHRLLIDSWAQAVWETDAHGVVVTDSPSWRACTGQTLEEWLGYGWLDAIHPDDRPFAERQWQEATAAHGLVDAEFRLRTPDGGWRWTNVRAAPVLDGSGKIGKWAGINIDIDARKQAEVALRESEERFRHVVQATHDIVWDIDLVADRVWWSEALQTNLGFAADEIGPDTKWCFAQMHPDDCERVIASMKEAAAGTGSGWSSEFRFRRADGTCADVANRGFIIRDKAGRALRMTGAMQDVTLAKHAEAALRESEERQTFLLKLSDALRAESDAEAVAHRALKIFYDHLRLDRCYITFYRSAEGEAEFFYQVGNETVPPLPAKVQLSDFPDANDQVLGKTFAIDDFEKRGLSEAERANSKALDLRAMVASTVRQGENNPLCSLAAISSRPRHWSLAEIALVEDVAERTWAAVERARAEAALRESEERFAQFAASSSDALWIRDAGTLAMEYTSPAIQTIYGIAPDGILGDLQRWVGLIEPEDRDVAVAHIEQAKAGAPVTHEFRIRRPVDGEVRWIRNTDFPLHDIGGSVQRIGGIAEDVTEARRAAERQGVLTAELQHRTRNLMGVVSSLADKTIARSADLPDLRSRFSDRLAALARVQGLLSRHDEWDPVTFDELIRSEISAINGEAERVVLSGPSGVALRFSTVQTFALALHELATNALKYGALAQPRGQLVIRWRLERAGRDGQPWLHVDWREFGVTMPDGGAPPRGGGSGRELIEQALPYQLGAKTTFVLAGDGVHCTIALPVSERQVAREMIEA